MLAYLSSSALDLPPWSIIAIVTLWGGLTLMLRDAGIPYGLDPGEAPSTPNYPWQLITMPRVAKEALAGTVPAILLVLYAGQAWYWGTALWLAIGIGYSFGHFKSLGLKTLGEGLLCALSGMLLTVLPAALLWWLSGGSWLVAGIVLGAGALKPCGYAIGWALRPDGSPYPGSFALGSTLHGLTAYAALGWALTRV